MGKGRPNKYISHVKPYLSDITEMALTMTEKQIAQALGVAYSSFKEYKKLYSDLADALKNGRNELVKDLRSTLIHKAQGYDWTEIKRIKGKNLVDSVVENVKALPGKMVEIGKNLTSGIWEGISSGTAWIKSKITAWVGDVVSFIKNLFGIHSPSKVMEDEVGKNIALGIIKGVDGEKKNVKKSAEELANLYVSAAKNRASELKKANKLTEKQEVVFWKEIVSHCKKGKKAYNTAAAQLTTSRNTLKKDIAELTQTYVSGIGKVREQLQNDIAQLQNKYVDTVTSRVSDIANSFGLLNSVSFDEALSKDDLTRNLSEQAYAIEEWDKVLRSLEGRLGKDSGLYSQLQQMDVSSLETLKSINSMTDEELKRYEYLYNRKQTLAQQRAEYEYVGLKEQTEAQVKELEKSASKQMTELKQAYKKGLKQLGVTVGKESGGIGEAISAGIASGLKKGTAELDGTLKSFAKSTLKKLKQEWGIKSPSRVMRDQVGKYLAIGIADGIKSNQDAVSKAMENLKQSLVKDVNLDFGAAKSRIVAAGTSGQAAQNGNGQSIQSEGEIPDQRDLPAAVFCGQDPELLQPVRRSGWVYISCRDSVCRNCPGNAFLLARPCDQQCRRRNSRGADLFNCQRQGNVSGDLQPDSRNLSWPGL